MDVQLVLPEKVVAGIVRVIHLSEMLMEEQPKKARDKEAEVGVNDRTEWGYEGRLVPDQDAKFVIQISIDIHQTGLDTRAHQRPLFGTNDQAFGMVFIFLVRRSCPVPRILKAHRPKDLRAWVLVDT